MVVIGSLFVLALSWKLSKFQKAKLCQPTSLSQKDYRKATKSLKYTLPLHTRKRAATLIPWQKKRSDKNDGASRCIQLQPLPPTSYALVQGCIHSDHDLSKPFCNGNRLLQTKILSNENKSFYWTNSGKSLPASFCLLLVNTPQIC